MGIFYSSIIDSSDSEVFKWYSRSGAFSRLSPPWNLVSINYEAKSIRNGYAKLNLPAKLYWNFKHLSSQYNPPNRFLDKTNNYNLVAIYISPLLQWSHTHFFEAISSKKTRVIDLVETRVSKHFFQNMFAYRHQQLTDDLYSHKQAYIKGFKSVNIAITGSSGLIGSALVNFLNTGGHRVIKLVRRKFVNYNERQWNPDNPDFRILDDIDVLVHLAGAPIAGRFTYKHYKTIKNSRVKPTIQLIKLINQTTSKLKVIITASAIGFYGQNCSNEILTENSKKGSGYLAEITSKWESVLDRANISNIRKVHIRTGIVQSPTGGMLGSLLPLFSTGLGNNIGKGQNWLSWIGIDDLIDIYYRAMWDSKISGPINAVSPQPVCYQEYVHTLGSILHRPTVLSLSPYIVKILFGKSLTKEIIYSNKKVVPLVLKSLGHHFRQPSLEKALRHILGYTLNN